MRQEEYVEGAFQAKPQNNKGSKNKKKHNKANKLGGSASSNKNSQSSNTQVFPPCLYCKKPIIHKISVGGGQMRNVTSVVN